MWTFYFTHVVSSFFLLFFLAYSQRSQIGCLPYFRTWRGLSANLECRSEACCTTLAGNAGLKNRQKFAICAPSQNICRAISSQLRHVSVTGKNLLNGNIFSISPHNMASVSPLTAEIGSGVWGTRANFNEFRVMASLLHRRRATEVNQTLHDVWPSSGLVHIYIFVRGALAP